MRRSLRASCRVCVVRIEVCDVQSGNGMSGLEVSALSSSSARGSCTDGGWPVRGTCAGSVALRCPEFSTGERRDLGAVASTHVMSEPALPHLMSRKCGPSRIRHTGCPDGGDDFSHIRGRADAVLPNVGRFSLDQPGVPVPFPLIEFSPWLLSSAGTTLLFHDAGISGSAL